MEFYKDCPDEILIEIFKNLDLKSRSQASRTCQRWNRLFHDRRANIENVSCIVLEKCNFTKASLKKLFNDSLSNVIKNMMDGLSDQIGKVQEFRLDEDDVQILSRINEIINDGGGRLKIDKFSLTTYQDIDHSYPISDRINAIIPSTVRELSVDFRNKQIFDCDWSRLSQLPLLKYLNINLYYVDHDRANTLFTFVPNIEELRISCYYFESNTFSDFLSTIKNKLTNLRRLKFERVGFNYKAISRELIGSFFIDTLKEIEFKNCFENWMEAANLFLCICSLDILRLDAKLEMRTDLFDIYDLASSIKGNTKLGLSIDTALDYKSDRGRTPTEFDRTLTELCLKWIQGGRGASEHLQDFFNYNSYENLIDIRFEYHQGLDSDILKRIAQSCLRLETLHILDGTYRGYMSDQGLRSFLIHWEERRSKRLSITLKIIDLVKIDGLFGTSSVRDRGILNERWMREYDENGPSTSKSEKTLANDKYWKIFRKTFSIDKYSNKKGTRLIIWDRGYPDNGIDQKLLVIKDYDKNKLDANLYVKTI